MARAYLSTRSSLPLMLFPLMLFPGLAITQGAALAAPGPAAFVQGEPLTQDLYLKASNTGAGDRFGWSIAAFGDRVIVGAPNEDSSSTGVNGAGGNDSATNSGAAYVFRLEAGQWVRRLFPGRGGSEHWYFFFFRLTL